MKIDLNGQWSYFVEGGESGTVKVPSAYDFVKRVVFTRNFELSKDELDKYDFSVVMFGVNYQCEVTINGDLIGNHVGGYGSFVLPIPPNTLEGTGDNNIRVAVDNTLDTRMTIPLRSQVWGWRNYGGILRDIFLLGIPKLSVRHVHVKSMLSPSNASATVTVRASFAGLESALSIVPIQSKKPTGLGLVVELVHQVSGITAGRSTVAPVLKGEEGWTDTEVSVVVQNPKLWSPNSPELYRLKCYLVQTFGRDYVVIDEFDLNYGIRTISIAKGNILLNGDRVILKGVVWVEDHPRWGSAITHEDMEKDIVSIKNLSANVVRFGNHPPHPYLLNLCDRYGLLAMVELPVVNVPAAILADENFSDLAVTMVKEMIVRDRHHASVFAWGLGDECESSAPAARRFVELLVKHAKELDDRPAYFGSRMISNDRISELVDIAAVNIREHDVKMFSKQLEEWKRLHPSQPVIVGKFGTDVQHTNHNGYSDPLSQEAQARFYLQRMDVIKALDYDGALIWSFNDWKGDRPSLVAQGGDPWMYTMGLVSYQREKRVAYDAVRSSFRAEKFVALPMGSYSSGASVMYVVSGLVVLIGVAYLYNSNRRFRSSVNRSVFSPYNFFADVRDQHVVSLVQSTLLGMMVSVATGIVASSMFYHFRTSWVLDNLLSYILVFDNIKEYAIRIMWDPLKSIIYFSVLCFGLLVVTAGVLLGFSLLWRRRMLGFHAYTITMWATTPLLILVPVGMILYRVIESPMYVLPALMLLLLLIIWIFLRMLKGIAIFIDAFRPKVYLVGVLSAVGGAAVVYLYLDYTQSASAYLSYMYNVMVNSQ